MLQQRCSVKHRGEKSCRWRAGWRKYMLRVSSHGYETGAELSSDIACGRSNKKARNKE